MFKDVTPEFGSRIPLIAARATRLPPDPGDQAALLQTLLDESRDAILVVDSPSTALAEFRVVYVNRAFLQAGLGKAVRGLAFCEALTPYKDALADPGLQAHVRASLDAGLVVRGELLTGMQVGQSRPVRMDIAPLSGRAGSQAGSTDSKKRWLITLRDVTEQQSLEEALEQAVDRYRLLTESMADVVSVHNASYRFLYVTPSVYRLTGYTVEEMLEQNPRDYVHPHDLPGMLGGSSHVPLDDRSFRVEWRCLRKDGTYLWLETTATEVYDSAGHYRLVCNSRDISQRKRTEAVLSDEQTLLRTLIESLPDQIHVKDRQGRYLLNNQAHRRERNLQIGEVFGKTIRDLFPPELARIYERDDEEVIRTGQPMLHREEPTVDRNGATRWLSTTKTPLFDSEGTVIGIVGVSRDITERREAAKELWQSAAEYKLLFQSNPQPMWVYDAKTLAFLAVNDMAVSCYGYSREEFLRMSLIDIRPSEDIPALLETLTLTAGNPKVSGPWRHRRKDGSELRVDVHSHPLIFNDHNARLVVANNVTEQWRIAGENAHLLSQTKILLAEAVERADRDPLTGLLNHRAFHKRLAEEAGRAECEGKPLAIAMLDLDNFKFFNDGYGHSVGDDVLRQVTLALAGTLRSYDTLARFGGDEFALLLPNTDAEEAVRLADRLVASLADVGYRPPGYDVRIPLTVSIGLAIFPDDAPNRLEALATADARLLRVKTGGTGRVGLSESLRVQLSGLQHDFSMLNALVTAVDAKDRYTRHHSEDVMSCSLGIAQELGLDEAAQQQILLAALLHDVGKIGVPDHILRKPGLLTEEEFEAIKQHPMMGSSIVGAVPGFEGTLPAIRHHHERWDGGGYPLGLSGEDIPLIARLMAVADAFSAMTTDRPYRKGMEDDRACRILEAGAGTQWDPACVAAFLRSHRRQEV